MSNSRRSSLALRAGRYLIMMTPVRQGSTLITDSDRWLPFYPTRLTWSPQFQAGPLWCRRLAALAWGLHHQAPTCRPFGSWLQGPGVNLQRATAMKPWKTSSATNEPRNACPSFRRAFSRARRRSTSVAPGVPAGWPSAVMPVLVPRPGFPPVRPSS